jgi:GDPmannose 4,6-dehydratase
VTRKIAHEVALIVLGKKEYLELGNMDAKRDWGYAKDYVEAMYLMLQQSEPDDYVVATGETHSVEEFVAAAFATVGVSDYKKYVKHNPKFDRPAEVDLLIGDASKAKKQLKWQPTVTFAELVKIMVEAELAVLKGEATLSDF